MKLSTSKASLVSLFTRILPTGIERGQQWRSGVAGDYESGDVAERELCAVCEDELGACVRGGDAGEFHL